MMRRLFAVALLLLVSSAAQAKSTPAIELPLLAQPTVRQWHASPGRQFPPYYFSQGWLGYL